MINIQLSMKKVAIIFYFSVLTFNFFGQGITQKLQKAFTAFEQDSQLKHAISSLYVIDANTGQVVFDKNSQIGLAPASTQKIITSVTAFELLGKDYRYKTELGYNGRIENDVLKGNLYIVGSGDPTLGSWRYTTTIDTIILSKWIKIVQDLRIKKVEGEIIGIDNKFETQITPDGWIWQDIGNYYGAGVSALNWHENQYDMKLKAGRKEGDSVEIISTSPEVEYNYLINELKTGPKGSGDNAYIYLPPYGYNAFVRGTIPLGENSFIISGSFAMPSHYPIGFLGNKLQSAGIKIKGDEPKTSIEYSAYKEKLSYPDKILFTHYSPSLDSIIYWLNKKSINLYAEALLKTFAYEKNGFGSTDSGVIIVQNFWKEKGMDEDELNIVDGSGLSPLNRVTTHSQVEILKYAKTKDWFPYFYNSLPEYNGMSMKSGTIRGVKGFCGYHKAKNGKEYIFSFLVNNYNGSASALVNKMYKVLDVLK
jgi:D-alanyl-D-alanine carboxypeptidase/D-alanyl-D-alanine-endopeptidase (penicillin-binding protein 4)